MKIRAIARVIMNFWYWTFILLTKRSQLRECTELPIVSIQQRTYFVNYGTQFTMNCTVQSDLNITEVFWNKHMNGIVTPLQFGMAGTKGMSTEEPSLTIQYATMIDLGSYKCFATNEVGTGQSNSVNVTVNGDLPNVTVTNERYTVGYGISITLNCVVVSYLPVLHVDWQFNKNGSIIILNEKAVGTKGITPRNPSLTLVSPRLSDSGMYTCVATNKVGTKRSKRISLSVIGDIPRVVAGGNYSVTYGSSVTLGCKATAVPNMTLIFWEKTRNGSKTVINHGAAGITGIERSNPSMTLAITTLADTGEYTCHARNAVGLGSSNTITLVVMGGLPVLKEGAPAYNIPYGQRITLVCSVSAIPEHMLVYWQKNTTGLITSINYNAIGTSGITPEIPSLTFEFPTLSDSGLYTCFAINAVGTGKSQSIVFKVTGDVPVISMKPSTYSVVYGKDVTLNCEVRASPNSTTVYWHKELNGRISAITKDSTGIEGSTVNNPSLTIKHATVSDSGLYTCFAKNAIGTGISNKPSNLSVIASIPTVSTRKNIYTSTEGQSLEIPCTVVSNPPHNYIYWKRMINDTTTHLIHGMLAYDGMTVANPSLLIKNVTMMTAGQYICSATNEVGTGHSSPTKIIVKPKEDELLTTPSSSSKNGDDNAGIVAGSVIGALICVLILVIVLIVYLRKR